MSNTYNLEEYQEFVSLATQYRGAHKRNQEELSYLALGIAGECGELVEIVKKIVRKHEYLTSLSIEEYLILRERVLIECGDVLWYITRLCSVFDTELADVYRANVTKLSERMKTDEISTLDRKGEDNE